MTELRAVQLQVGEPWAAVECKMNQLSTNTKTGIRIGTSADGSSTSTSTNVSAD